MSESQPLLGYTSKRSARVRDTWISVLFFTWLSPLLEQGSNKPLEFDDLYPLIHAHESKHISEEFHTNWNQIKMKATPPKKPQLLRALFKAFGWRFVIAGALRGIRATLLFTAPLILKAMISFLNNPSAPPSEGYFLVAIIFVSGILQSLCIRQYTYLSSEVGMCFRSAIQSALYQKSFVIAPSVKRSSGQVVNLMSVDATRVQKLTVDLYSIWVVPYLILLSCGLLWREIGVSFLAGLGVIALYIPLTLFVAKYMKSIQRNVLSFKDARTKLCNEAWSGMKVIKCQAWEDSFEELIETKRNAELDQLKRFLQMRSLSSALSNGLPAIVAIASFGMYVLLGNSLDVGTALTTLALFNILRLPLLKLPDMVNAIIEAQLSLERIRDYLLADERMVIKPGTLDAPGILLRNVTLHLPETSKAVLENISFEATSGSLIAIVGPTGSGKTSLLRGILGEAKALGGELYKQGSVAYVSQHPFILNATVRENILFGLPYDHARYIQAIDVCCLEADLGILAAGDQTGIGEKGITLSGGQKTRVALARAVYQNADVYLLDDILAAVDSHVGAQIFEQCVLRVLRSKVVLMVTNSPRTLSSCDRVVVLGENKILADGPLEEVASIPYLNRMFEETQIQSTEEATECDVPITVTKNVSLGSQPNLNGKIITEEERMRGKLTWDVYYVWLRACGGWVTSILILFVYIGCEGMSVAATIWLSYWSEHVDSTSMRFYLGVFVALQILYVVFIYLRSYVLFMAGVRGSRVLFSSMLGRILRAPMSFFETTPLGRIANRFTSDVYSADESLPSTWSSLLVTAITVLYTYATIIGVTPLFLVILVPIGYAYAQSQHYYIQTSRELQRLESISKSPVLSLFGETLEGISAIRAADATEAFNERMYLRIDKNQQALFLNFSVNSWLNLRLEFAGTIVASFAGLCAVWQHGSSSALFAGLAGVALSYAFTITKYMTQSVTTYSNLQTQMISIERIDSYTKLSTEEHVDFLATNLPPSWPTHGSIEFDQVCLKYQAHLPRVLHNLSFIIPPQAKVGVVGRTGAGKSSLMAVLLRLVKCESGRILIDDIDISTLRLRTVRNAVSIIPQDPVLFSGTIRSNLDPFSTVSDDELWNAVKRVHLNSITSLHDTVEERGMNYSVGERQLICIARALIRKSKIILMDEATSSIDPNTDKLIQQSMREVFVDRTTVTIAHRLNTIMDSDRILVIDNGSVAEYDTPDALLQKSSSIFASMARQGQTENAT